MIKIRKAAPEDISAIVSFQQKMAWETEQFALDLPTVTKGVTAVFRNPLLGQYWISEEEGNVIASLLITHEWSDWRNADVWWIQSVYVLPAYRRRGVFRSMYSYIKDEADHQNIAGLRLYVETKNSKAQKTYESLGMQSLHYKMYEWLRD
ncbi:MAG TPA: GNAT family N-acetyltransferase [Bacteroidales bacterium]|nr:GNAT family N-acetyltransferase [Bacteroidales bacterium]